MRGGPRRTDLDGVRGGVQVRRGRVLAAEHREVAVAQRIRGEGLVEVAGEGLAEVGAAVRGRRPGPGEVDVEEVGVPLHKHRAAARALRLLAAAAALVLGDVAAHDDGLAAAVVEGGHAARGLEGVDAAEARVFELGHLRRRGNGGGGAGGTPGARVPRPRRRRKTGGLRYPPQGCP